jgi:hypothetical protein
VLPRWRPPRRAWGRRRARSPFVSPDGRWIGYVDGTATVYKVAVAGGEPIEVTRLPGTMRGATWVGDGTIVLANQNPSGLWRGRAVLATLGRRTVVVDLDTGEWSDVLADGDDARYVPSGHLVYLRGDGLSAVRFDVSRRAVVGDPVRVIDRVALTGGRLAHAVVAPRGLLVTTADGEETSCADYSCWRWH